MVKLKKNQDVSNLLLGKDYWEGKKEERPV